MNNLAQELIIKLMASLTEVQETVKDTREKLNQRNDVPQDVFNRLDSYDEIVTKQKILCEELDNHFKTKNVVEIARCVKLMNCYSSMIRDDAHEILTNHSNILKQ